MLCIFYTDAYCLYVDALVGFERLVLDEDLIVSDNGILDASGIDVGTSISISNSGVINSDFYVADSLRVYVKNSGEINGRFYLGSESHLIQVVESADDVRSVSADAKFSVLVRDADNVSLTDVYNVATNADKITLADSMLVLDGVIDSGAPDIELVGDVVFILNGSDTINEAGPILQKVSGDGTARFDVLGLNPLFRGDAEIDKGNLYLRLVRETDYVKILKNDMGAFLNNLRRSIPGDKLLHALDGASDMDALHSVMAESVRLHPINLMQPVRRMDMFDVLGGWRYADGIGTHSALDIMFSDSDFGYRINVAAFGDVTRDLSVAISGHVGAIDVSDDINDFVAYTYGANVAAHYDDGQILGNLLVGAGYADFDVGPVLDGADVVNNPDGISGFAAMDIGVYAFESEHLRVAPFAGVLTHYVSVLGEKDIVTHGNLGLGINWTEHEFDILYDYGVRGGILTDGTLYANAYAKFSAPFDDIGAELGFGLIRSDNEMGYKGSVSGYVRF